MAEATEILCEGEALDRLGGDQELYEEIIEMFFQDAPRQVEQLEAALGAGDLETATRHAHSLKGAAANIGAERLRAAALSAERLGDGGDSSGLQSQLAGLKDELLKVLSHLEARRR